MGAAVVGVGLHFCVFLLELIDVGSLLTEDGFVASQRDGRFDEFGIVLDDFDPAFFAEVTAADVLLVVGIGFVEQLLGVDVEGGNDLLPTGTGRGGLFEGKSTHGYAHAFSEGDDLFVCRCAGIVVNQNFAFVSFHGEWILMMKKAMKSIKCLSALPAVKIAGQAV